MDPNTISAELLRGYRIGERVIRHSMVRVTKQKMSDVSDDSEFEEVEVPTAQADPPSDQDSGNTPHDES